MTRQYRLSPEGRVAQVANAAKARESRDSVDTYIRKIVEKAPPPTPEQAAKIRAWLASAPSTNERADS